MKRIYLVRHGESEGNAGDKYQGPQSPLSEKGKQQAEAIADRFTSLPIEKIVASTQTRAKETAEIIGKKIGKDITLSDLFIEKVRPSEQIGLVRDSDKSIAIHKFVRENFGKPGVRYSDEETYDDMNERAKKALELLTKESEDHIAVVTHGLFLRVLCARAVFGDDMTPNICLGFLWRMKTENTGLTILDYDEEEKDWSVLTWNDHAHL